MSRPETPAPSSAATGPAPARSRGRQTALDMVRSLVVILACVGVVLLLAPQPDGVEQPQLSDAEAAAALEQAADRLPAGSLLLLAPGGAGRGQSRVPPDAAVPLPEDWRLDYARTEERDDVPTWRVGVLSPGQRRVDLEQAVAPTEEWLTRADAGRPGLPEPVEVGGLTWTLQERGDGSVSYTWAAPAGGADGVTTAVSASTGSDDLLDVVEAVSAALTDG